MEISMSSMVFRFCSQCAIGSAKNEISSEVFFPYQDFPDLYGCPVCGPGYFSNTLGATECSLCDPGSFSNREANSGCALCGPGYFASIQGATDCVPCSRGSFSDIQGATECSQCAPGSFSDIQGATECSQCAPGSFSDGEGSPYCSLCSPGSFSNEEGSAICELCPEGRYQPESGRTECVECPEDFETNAAQGATECTPKDDFTGDVIYHKMNSDGSCTDFTIPEHCTNAIEHMRTSDIPWDLEYSLGSCLGINSDFVFVSEGGTTTAGGCTSGEDEVPFTMNNYIDASSIMSEEECLPCTNFIVDEGLCYYLFNQVDPPTDTTFPPECDNVSCHAFIEPACVESMSDAPTTPDAEDDDLAWFAELTELCTSNWSFDVETECCGSTQQCTTLPDGSQSCYSVRGAPELDSSCNTCADIARVDDECLISYTEMCTTLPDGSANCVTGTVDVSQYCPSACSSETSNLDLMFLMDYSSSMTAEEFDLMKTFAQNLVLDYLQPGGEVAAMGFGTYPIEFFEYDSYWTQDLQTLTDQRVEITEKTAQVYGDLIMSNAYHFRGATNLGSALRAMLDGNPQHNIDCCMIRRDRSDRRKLLIIMTDGIPTDLLPPVVEDLEASNTEVVLVGIGPSFVPQYTQQLTEDIVTVTDFEDLESHLETVGEYILSSEDTTDTDYCMKSCDSWSECGGNYPQCYAGVCLPLDWEFIPTDGSRPDQSALDALCQDSAEVANDDDDLAWFSKLEELCTSYSSFDLEAECCGSTQHCIPMPDGSQSCYSVKAAPDSDGACSTCSGFALVDEDCSIAYTESYQIMPDGSQNSVTGTLDITQYCPSSCEAQTSETTISPTDVEDSEEPSSNMDLMFLMDVSSSMTDTDFDLMKNFASELTWQYLQPGGEVAAVGFGTRPIELFEYDSYQIIDQRVEITEKTAQVYGDLIMSNAFHFGGATNLGAAIDAMLNGDPNNGIECCIIRADRDDRERLLIIMTDGVATDLLGTVRGELFASNTKVVVVGIGPSFIPAYMSQLVQSTEDIIAVESFDNLDSYLETVGEYIFPSKIATDAPEPVCEDGEMDNSDPCEPKECVENDWVSIIVDCAEQMGMECLAGWMPAVEGTCCSTCPCDDIMCTMEVCSDGSNPPVPEGECCGDMSLCPTEAPEPTEPVSEYLVPDEGLLDSMMRVLQRDYTVARLRSAGQRAAALLQEKDEDGNKVAPLYDPAVKGYLQKIRRFFKADESTYSEEIYGKQRNQYNNIAEALGREVQTWE